MKIIFNEFLCFAVIFSFILINFIQNFTVEDLDSIREVYLENNYNDSDAIIKNLLEKTSDDIDSSVLLNNLLSVDSLFGQKLVSKLVKLYNTNVTSSFHINPEELLLRNILLGDGMPQSIIDAVELTQKHLALGSSYAQAVQSFLTSVGINSSYSSLHSLIHGTFSSYGNNIDGMMMMARRYKDGLNVEESCEYSYDLYQKITKKVFRSKRIFDSFSIDQHLHMNNNENRESLISDDNWLNYVKYMSQNGKEELSFALGELYYFGLKGINRDWTKAKQYFEQSLSRNQYEAAVYLARIHAEGNSVIHRNLNLAYKYFEFASNKGIKAGSAGIATMKLFGLGVERNLVEALQIFKTVSGEHGPPEANAFYGIMKMYGLGCKVDVQSALENLMLAAKNGSTMAVYYISIIHRKGLGVFSSCQLALEFIRVVLERNIYGRLINEAYKRFEVKSDIESSLMIYLWLSEVGIQSAQINAAHLLSHYKFSYFNSMEHQRMLAFKYWYLSSGKGNTAVEVNLGDCYYYGKGIDLNYSLAAFYYKRAAESGSVEGYFNLAFMYENGLGMSEDLVMAENYYLSAKALSENKWSSIPINLALTKLQIKSIVPKLSIVSLKSTMKQLINRYDRLTLITILVFMFSVMMASFVGLRKIFRITSFSNDQSYN